MVRCFGCMAEYKQEFGLCPYCGYELDEDVENAMHLQQGEMLKDRYLIGKSVGYGGFGVTYIAWDSLLKMRVAIKEYLPSEFATRTSGQTHLTIFGGNKAEQFLDGKSKFSEEAKRLVQFQNEPGIVRVFDSFECNNTAYIVMEYLDGETLTQYLERTGTMSVDTAIYLLMPMIISLEVVHGKGIIHRDIAPDNIMVTKDGQFKLIDFGAARYATTSHSRSLTIIIKPGYSPEEQYRSSNDQGAHTDVYALAAVLYYMVTGVVPPDALERRAFFENKKKDILEAPSKYCTIHKNQETALLNAMNIRIEDRTKSVKRFLEEITSEGKVKRIFNRIKGLDLMRWPLWAKILVPVSGAVVACLFGLLLTGNIAFTNNLVMQFTMGTNMTRVPNIINCSVEAAQESLVEMSLQSMISGRQESEVIPANIVMSQSVDAGSVIEKDTLIEMYISAAIEELEEGIMPDVTYYNQIDANDMLVQLGAVVVMQEQFSDTIASGIVISSSVAAGESLEEGDSVILFVSKGKEEVEVPEEETEAIVAATVKAASTTTTTTTKATSLNQTKLSLEAGEQTTLVASGGNGSYTWSSSNTSVATVSGGKVTAKSNGYATITVTSNNTTAVCAITVESHYLTLSKNLMTLSKGETSTLSTSGVPSGTSVSWSSNNASIASVSSSGKVTGTGDGTTLITASYTYGGITYGDACSVTVEDAGISLYKSSVTLSVGDTQKLSSSTTPSTANISWSSSNTSVASVSSTGTVTAKSGGSATITASITSGNTTYKDTCKVTVEEEEEEVEFEFSDSKITLDEGDTEWLDLDTNLDDGDAEWSSSNTSVATVSSSGKVTAVGEGTAKITAEIEYDGDTYYDTCTITVEAIEDTSADSSAFSAAITDYATQHKSASTTLEEGETLSLSFDNLLDGITVTWSSSNTSVATVNSKGKVTAVGEGYAYITATMEYTTGAAAWLEDCKITVEAAEPKIIEEYNDVINLSVGDAGKITATITSGDDPEWSTSNKKVVTVSNDGEIEAVGVGTAEVKAEMYCGGDCYWCIFPITVS